MQRSDVRPSVRPAVCPVVRQPLQRAAGLLLSVPRARRIDRQRTAANAGSVMFIAEGRR